MASKIHQFYHSSTLITSHCLKHISHIVLCKTIMSGVWTNWSLDIWWWFFLLFCSHTFRLLLRWKSRNMVEIRKSRKIWRKLNLLTVMTNLQICTFLGLLRRFNEISPELFLQRDVGLKHLSCMDIKYQWGLESRLLISPRTFKFDDFPPVLFIYLCFITF